MKMRIMMPFCIGTLMMCLTIQLHTANVHAASNTDLALDIKKIEIKNWDVVEGVAEYGDSIYDRYEGNVESECHDPFIAVIGQDAEDEYGPLFVLMKDGKGTIINEILRKEGENPCMF